MQSPGASVEFVSASKLEYNSLPRAMIRGSATTRSSRKYGLSLYRYLAVSSRCRCGTLSSLRDLLRSKLLQPSPSNMKVPLGYETGRTPKKQGVLPTPTLFGAFHLNL